jgi:peptidoglycan hydrolase-like protein with peptidoglycan-binding domain
MKTFSRLAISLLIIGAPLLAGADQTSDLQAQVQTLLSQVQQLQQKGVLPASAGSSSGGSCPALSRTLKLGMSGTDVTQLQQYLATDPSVYPEGTVTGYFGNLTQTAVQRFQTKYAIVSSGSPATTGYGVVGPHTMSVIAANCSGGAGVGTGNTSTVGGYLQLTPVQGTAPLTAQVQAVVNTVNSCAAATYSLDFGDGTAVQQIIVPSGACQRLTQSFSHVYPYGGVYLIKLYSGTHQTGATIQVTGAAAPAPTTSTTNGNGTNTTANGMPAESFSATPTSGSAPLVVNFSGTVTSADAAWNGGGNDTLVFGDGATASVPLPTAASSWQTYNVAHTYAQGTFTATMKPGAATSGNTPIGSVTVVSGSGASYAYGQPTVTPGANSVAFAVTLQFDSPSICDPYQISWGDGSTPVTYAAPAGSTSCATGVQTISQVHTYSAAGNYTVTLMRGFGYKQNNTASVVLSN